MHGGGRRAGRAHGRRGFEDGEGAGGAACVGDDAVRDGGKAPPGGEVGDETRGGVESGGRLEGVGEAVAVGVGEGVGAGRRGKEGGESGEGGEGMRMLVHGLSPSWGRRSGIRAFTSSGIGEAARLLVSAGSARRS